VRCGFGRSLLHRCNGGAANGPVGNSVCKSSPCRTEVVKARRKGAAAERVLEAELTPHLGYPESGAIARDIPRDRDGSFAPQFVSKGARCLLGFDETVLMLYARGLSTRELQAFLEERYRIPVSPDLISTITSEVLAEVETWQQRPLEATYVAVAFDAPRVRIRDEGVVQNKAVYLALGVQLDGTKEVLGFRHREFRQLQGRGTRPRSRTRPKFVACSTARTRTKA